RASSSGTALPWLARRTRKRSSPSTALSRTTSIATLVAADTWKDLREGHRYDRRARTDGGPPRGTSEHDDGPAGPQAKRRQQQLARCAHACPDWGLDAARTGNCMVPIQPAHAGIVHDSRRLCRLSPTVQD